MPAGIGLPDAPTARLPHLLGLQQVDPSGRGRAWPALGADRHYRIEVRWLGKASLFTGWRGPIMRRLGGIPVERSDPSRVVAEVVARIRSGEVFGLVVTPDGTRGANEYWKAGF